MTTLQQLQKRQKQLNNLIKKFPTVRALVRRWAFELTVVEGQIEVVQQERGKTKKMTGWQEIKKDFENLLLSVFDSADKSKLSKKFDAQKCIKNNWEIMIKDWEGRVHIEPSARAMRICRNLGGEKFQELEIIARRIDAYKEKAGWNPQFEDKEWHFGAGDEESF